MPETRCNTRISDTRIRVQVARSGIGAGGVEKGRVTRLAGRGDFARGQAGGGARSIVPPKFQSQKD